MAKKPVTALVLVHTDSIDSFADVTEMESPEQAEQLALSMEMYVKSHKGPVIVVRQGWKLRNRYAITFLREAENAGAYFIKFDEGEGAKKWGPFLKKLRLLLNSLNVSEVEIGGIWYTDDLKSGCVSHTVKYLRRYFPTKVLLDAVAHEDWWNHDLSW